MRSDDCTGITRSLLITTSIVIFALALLAACDLVPRKVAMNDPRIQPLLEAAQTFNRSAYGFTPLPQVADVRWESRPTATYDAMLHIDSKTSRTVAFRKNGGTWMWIGEQEMFNGPKMFKTVDGTFPEHIVLTYETEHISGVKPNELVVDYLGEDPRLANKRNLALADVKSILKEWGY